MFYSVFVIKCVLKQNRSTRLVRQARSRVMSYFIVAVAAGMAIGLASTAVNAHPAPAGGGSGKQHLGRQAPTSKRSSDSEAQTGHQKHARPHRSGRSERAHGRMRHEQ